MNKSAKDALYTALMILEIGTDEGHEKFGTSSDYMVAAHSFIQFAMCGKHTCDEAVEMVAKIWTVDAIQNASHTPREEGSE